MNKWYLISSEDTEEIRRTLVTAKKHIDKDCAGTGCMCDYGEVRCSEYYRDAIHTLDSGLHITDAIPSDYEENNE